MGRGRKIEALIVVAGATVVCGRVQDWAVADQLSFEIIHEVRINVAHLGGIWGDFGRTPGWRISFEFLFFKPGHFSSPCLRCCG